MSSGRMGRIYFAPVGASNQMRCSDAVLTPPPWDHPHQHHSLVIPEILAEAVLQPIVIAPFIAPHCLNLSARDGNGFGHFPVMPFGMAVGKGEARALVVAVRGNVPPAAHAPPIRLHRNSK